MRNLWRWLALVLAVVMLTAACGDSDDDDAEAPATTEAPAETEAPATTEGGDALELLIWADDTRTPVIEEFATAFEADQGVSVRVQEVPFDDIDDDFIIAAPAGEGPDIIVGANDWIGNLANNGLVAPLELGARADEFTPVGIDAMSFDGVQYGLPYATENIALIRNTDLVPEPVSTWEELEEIALGLVADGTVEIPLAIQQATADPYHNYPLYTAVSGEEIFGRTAEGGYDPEVVTLDTEGGLAAARAFGEWTASGLLNGDISYDIMIDGFAAGEIPFAVTGPWAVNDAERGFVQAGVPFSVDPFPTIRGGEARPFVGVQGFYVSSFSENQLLAQTFVLDYLGTEEAQLALFEAGGRAPAHAGALAAIADDPVIQGFGAAGANGVPIPAIPAMNSVWTAWTDAYTLIFAGNDPETAFTDGATQIRNLIAES